MYICMYMYMYVYAYAYVYVEVLFVYVHVHTHVRTEREPYINKTKMHVAIGAKEPRLFALVGAPASRRCRHVSVDLWPEPAGEPSLGLLMLCRFWRKDCLNHRPMLSGSLPTLDLAWTRAARVLAHQAELVLVGRRGVWSLAAAVRAELCTGFFLHSGAASRDHRRVRVSPVHRRQLSSS